MANKASVFRFADVEVREREFSLIKAGEVLPVEPKAFRVLLILLRKPQKLLPKEELLTAVWGDTAVGENSLARSIALLRRLLGDEARDPQFIETVATVGYRWVSKVEVSEEASGDAEPSTEPVVPRTEETPAKSAGVGWWLAPVFSRPDWLPRSGFSPGRSPRRASPATPRSPTTATSE